MLVEACRWGPCKLENNELQSYVCLNRSSYKIMKKKKKEIGSLAQDVTGPAVLS